MGGLEFNEDQGNAVDEANEVGATRVEVAVHPELGDKQEIVVLGLILREVGRERARCHAATSGIAMSRPPTSTSPETSCGSSRSRVARRACCWRSNVTISSRTACAIRQKADSVVVVGRYISASRT